MSKKIRACEICGKNDMPTTVCSSTIGGFSMNYCTICLAMGAEQRGYEDVIGVNYTYYDNETDMYKDGSSKSLEIITKSGKKFKTRNEFVKNNAKG